MRRRGRKHDGSSGKLRRVTATEAARNFSDLMNRVHYGNEGFVVERGGRAVCEIRPAQESRLLTGAELVELLRSLPHPGDEYLDAVEAVISRQPAAEGRRWRR